MGVMDKFLNAMRLNSDEDDYYDDDFYDEEEEEDDEEEDDYEPRRRSPFRSRTRNRDDGYEGEDDDYDDYDAQRRPATSQRSFSQQSSSKVTPMRAVRRTSGSYDSSSTNMEVCVIKPVSIDDAREITETLITYRTVILNLEGLDLDIAQRIIDFTSGSCYAVNGNLQKISNYIFVVTPANVDISGDIQNIMSAFGGTSAIQTDI